MTDIPSSVKSSDQSLLHHSITPPPSPRMPLARMSRPLLTAAAAAYMGGFNFGFTIGYSSPAIPQLQDENLLDEESGSWFASLMTIGALTGCLLAGWVIEKYGRRGGLFLTALPFLLGRLLLASGASSTLMLFTARALTGVSSGMVIVCCPLFIAETSPPNLRGMLGAGVQLSITVGILTAYSGGLWLGWRYLAMLGLVPTLLQLLLSRQVPDTPRYLVAKGKRSEALTALRYLRGPGADIEDECRDIQEGLDADQTVDWMDLLRRPELRQPLKVAVALMVLQQLTGINVVMFYTVAIFQSAGFGEKGQLAGVMVGAVQVVATLASCVMMDRVGRRRLLLLAGSGMALMCLTFGYYYYQQAISPPEAGEASLGWLALTSLLGYIVAFSLGWGPIPMLVMSEIFPAKARGRASSIAALSSWITAFIVTKEYATLRAAVGDHGTFWLFAIGCVLGLIFVGRSVPETKGKTLEDIELYFLGRAIRGI